MDAFAVSDVAWHGRLVGHCDNVALFRTVAGLVFLKTAESEKDNKHWPSGYGGPAEIPKLEVRVVW